MTDTSNRTEILYLAIKNYLLPEYSFLDIGCGCTPLYLGTALPDYVHSYLPKATYCGLDSVPNIIKHCKIQHPYYEWINIEAEEFIPNGKYNVIIHTGIDKKWSNGYKIHDRLLDNSYLPDIVLLEAGCRIRETISEELEVYNLIKNKYLECGYCCLNTIDYIWDLSGINNKRRFLMVMGEQ